MQVLTVGNTGTRCMFHYLLMSYVSRLGQIENISFWLSVAITRGLCLFLRSSWMVEHVGGWLGPGKWDLPGDIRLGYLGRGGGGTRTFQEM